MKPYTFYLHEHRREAPSFEFYRCEDDEDARTHASELLGDRPGLISVEIYDGRETRFRVGRPDRAAPYQHAMS
jgi:hypothetical protein